MCLEIDNPLLPDGEKSTVKDPREVFVAARDCKVVAGQR
jgi:hypothetical protein